MGIYIDWEQLDRDTAACDSTGDPVDECPCVDVEGYDERDELDLSDKQRREEAYRG